MKARARCIGPALAILSVVGTSLSPLHAQTPTVYLPKFHNQATKLSPDGKLGQVLSRQSIPTTLAGADAWLIAYVSSDTLERKTVVTALVVAPKATFRRRGARSSRGRMARLGPPRTAALRN